MMVTAKRRAVEVFDGTGLDGPCLRQYIAIRRQTTRVVQGATYVMAIYGS